MTRMELDRRNFLQGMGGTIVGGVLFQQSTGSIQGNTSESWPQFGYDNGRSGYAPQNTAPAGEIEDDWSYATDGDVQSSPAVVDETIYTGSDNTVYALKATSGENLWAYSNKFTQEFTGDYDAATDATETEIRETKEITTASPTSGEYTLEYEFIENGDYNFDESADYEMGVRTLDAQGTELERISVTETFNETPKTHEEPISGSFSKPADSWEFFIATNGATETTFSPNPERRDHEGTVTLTPTKSDTGVLSSPAVADGTVYVGSDDGSVFGLDAADGTEQWQYETGGSVQSSPAVSDGTVYVGSDDGSVYGLDATDGTEQWQYETDGSVQSSPAVIDGSVYVGSDDGSVYGLDAMDGTPQWQYDTSGSVQSSPAVVDDTVFVGSDSGSVFGLDAADGSKQWGHEIDGSVQSSPAVADGTVYVGSGDGSVYGLDATDGTEQWQYETGGSVQSSPAVVGGSVYVGSDDGSVYGLDGTDGTEQWQYETGGSVQSSPAVVDSSVYVGSDDGSVYALSGSKSGGGDDPAPIVGDNPPQDLDGDGLCEDIDGDGDVDIFDVHALFNNLENDIVQENAELFNFSGTDPENVTLEDVQALYNLI